MSDTLDILRQIALQVRNASAPAENTAERVGRVLVGILENLSQTDIEDLKAMFLRKDQPDTANKLITFIEGLISKGLIIAEGGIKLPSGAALYSLYENGLLSFSMDENGFVIYEKGTANKWSVITSAGAEFQNLVIKFLAQITDLEVSNKATTLDLVVQALAKTYNLTVDNTADLMHGIIREYLTSESFVSGFLGSGFKIWKDANGDWNGEFDKLTVRKIFTIFELVVQKVVHQGGQVIRSAAGGKLVKVTDGGTYWKCEHDSTDDFLPDDQVLCQTFTGTSIKRYWRKVTSAGAGYFNLSKTDCEDGSATPEVGDNVAVLGNRTNTDRQSAQIDCAVGVNAPYRDDYAGINSYSLAGKLINRTGNLSGITDPDFGVLSGSGLIGMNAYLKGVFRLKSSGKLVEDAISDAQSESNAYTDGKITTVETNFEIREGQISSKVTQATTAATQASGYATSAQGSASTATTKATAASNSANAAAGSATTAGQKAADAAGSATAAQDAADDAATILSQVTTKESSINQTASNITLQVSEVTTKVTTATSKASEAATSASNAKTSETNASGSASTASSKASAAATSATNAANSATAAAGSATTAANILTEVTEKKSSIDQTADSITLKVSEVNTKTAQAVTSATNSANSATTASTAAGTATTKATEAANSASTATTKATAASGSASAAATSATNAATSAANAANILTSVTTKQSEINQTAGNITLQVTEVTTKTVQATNAAELAMAMSKGKMLYRDPTFESGGNGTNQYLNNATRTIETVAGCPNPLAKAMVITATGWHTSSDLRIAGFNFSNLSRANAIFIVRIVALIPVGRSINNYHNAYGTGGTTQWLTSQAGTGAWTEYVCKVICGSSGTFNTINHFALVGGVAPTASSPVSWYVAYASVWDVTAVDDVPTRTEASSDAQTKANTAESNAKTYSNNTFTTKTDFSSQLTILSSSISAKVSQTDFNSLNTRVSSAEAKITPDAINLTVRSQTESIAAQAAEQTFVAVDATGLDPNKYYPITIGMSPYKPYTITVRRGLGGGYGIPSYATHSQGFSTICKWTSNGSGWGAIDIKRIVDIFTYSFVGSPPIGNIGQLSESSQEYIYVRGGSKYDVIVERAYGAPVTLRTSNYTWTSGSYSQTLNVLDSLPSYPEVTYQSKSDIKAGISIVAGGISIFGNELSFAGKVTFSSLDSSTQSTINGKATTGYVDTAKSAAISAAATDATTKANNAQSAAISAAATDATTKANSALASAKTYSDTLKNSLGSLAYLSAVSLAKLDSTIVEGGYIKTSLIDANAIITGSLLANKIAATDITTTRLTVSEGCTVGGFAIGNGRIGSIASATGSGGELAIYSNFFRVGGSDGYVMLGNNVIPATAGGAFNATGRIVNQTVNQGAYWGYDACNTGLYISVSGGTKNFGIDSNAALKAPAFINTRVKYLVFGTSYLIDLSQYSVFMCYAASAKSVIMPDETSIAKQFSLSSLPSDFGCIFTFHVIGGSSDITLNNVIDWNMSSINLRLVQGDSVQLLVTKFPNFHYQVINHTD